MIRVTRLNGQEIFVNAELVKFVEATPDTLISLTDGDRFNVREKPEQVIASLLAYRRYIHQPPEMGDQPSGH